MKGLRKRIVILIVSLVVLFLLLYFFALGGEDASGRKLVSKWGEGGTFRMSAMENFTIEEVSDEWKTKMIGACYPEGEEALISFDELRVLHVLYYNFEGKVKEGDLVCNVEIAEDLQEIFFELYMAKYPIEKIATADEYGGDDDLIMAENVSSSFNYRTVYGTDILSKHGLGMAVDINPLYNPYITYVNGSEEILPVGAEAYADRSADFSYKIDHEDLCYKLFTEHGFTWGGDWEESKDYQHFER